MIKHIIHISDIHIRTLKLHDLHIRQFGVFIDEIKEKFKYINKDEIRIVITGDIVDQKINISNEQILILTSFLIKLKDIGKVIILPGNHDFLVNNPERVDSLSPIVNLINDENIVLYKDRGVFIDENVKWVIYSLYENNLRPDFENDGEYVHVGLFHGPINGLSTDLGFVFENVYQIENFKGCDIVLCGDIHKRSVLTLEEKRITGLKKIPIIQIGSFLQNNFGETVKHHGYGIYNVLEDQYDFFDLPNIQPFLQFKITDISDIENENEKLINLT